MIKRLLTSIPLLLCLFGVAQNSKHEVLIYDKMTQGFGMKDTLTGEIIIPAKYESIYEIKDTRVILVSIKGKYGVVRNDGTELSAVDYDSYEVRYKGQHLYCIWLRKGEVEEEFCE